MPTKPDITDLDAAYRRYDELKAQRERARIALQNEVRELTTQRDELRTALENTARYCERLAERMETPVRPGHCDYISKATAAIVVTEIAVEARAALTRAGKEGVRGRP